MYRQCKRYGCEHYAMHRVSAPKYRYEVYSCHLDVEWAVEHVVFFTSKWAKLVVYTNSEVVVGDVRDWRTRSISAYDELRQIGA